MQTDKYLTPGVYTENVFLSPAAEMLTGVPAFLGLTEKVPDKPNEPESFSLTRWPEFGQKFGKPVPDSYLADAVRGFFENGGHLCCVICLKDSSEQALEQGLAALAPVDTIDLVCAPDIMRPRQPGSLPRDPVEVCTMQAAVLKHCDELGDRFAILDSLPDASEDVLQQRHRLKTTNGALYYPWIRVLDGTGFIRGFVPPCGHVAGVYARSDQRVGVHKAPANEVLEGVMDLEVNLNKADQDRLNPVGVNCLRAFPGRGIRVWGARSLSADPAWTYINVRRLFLTVGRWIERNMPSVTFEPNDPKLWARIVRELTAYFNDLFRLGALKGRITREAFYVKCDGETNPPEAIDAGKVVTEIGLAPSVPNEFIIVRLIHGNSGITIVGPTRPI